MYYRAYSSPDVQLNFKDGRFVSFGSLLEELTIVDGKGDWKAWRKKMNARYGESIIWGDQQGNGGNWYDGIASGLRKGDAWLNDVMKENWIGNLAGSESSWMGEDGWKNKGWPTMKYTWGTLATIFTGGAFALESTALAHAGIMGTTTTADVGWWMYSGASFGVGAYNTYVPNNNLSNKVGWGTDALDIIKFINPFGVMNYGIRGIDYYESLKNKK
uniref:Ntox44 domain-containing protein n=1 Tax=Parastrongyloides trichosuri TaxID=131310 RepID=A0A0N4ZEB8_PARTI